MKVRDKSMQRIPKDGLATAIFRLGITTPAVLEFTLGNPEPHTPRWWSYRQGLAELVREGKIERRGKLIISKSK